MNVVSNYNSKKSAFQSIFKIVMRISGLKIPINYHKDLLGKYNYRLGESFKMTQ